VLLIRLSAICEDGRDRETNRTSCHKTEDAEKGSDHNVRSVTRPQRVNRKHKMPQPRYDLTTKP
jgi:hypothetical protein